MQVPGYGLVHGDVAWGGNWFFLASDHGQRVASSNLAGLTAYSTALKNSLVAQGICGADGAEKRGFRKRPRSALTTYSGH